MNLKIVFAFTLLAPVAYGMDASKKPAPQFEVYSRSTMCFLHQYVRANFCDIDERGVYFTGISSDESDITFTLSWDQVKKVLEKAFSNIQQQHVSRENLGPLTNEYAQVLRNIREFHALPRYEWNASSNLGVINPVAENRSLYKGAWIAGEFNLVKVALKLKLFSSDNDQSKQGR